MNDQSPINNLLNTEIYVIDIKTSATVDTPFWSETNRILEICIHHPVSDRTFYRVCDPGPEVKLPEVSHRSDIISRDTMKYNSKPTKTVLEEMWQFVVKEKSKDFLVVAYDPTYVTNMICKEMLLINKVEYGVNQQRFPWNFFHLRRFAKDKLEELHFTYAEQYEPYSLKRMATHFGCVASLGKLGTAFGNCMIIEDLFLNVVVPYILPELDTVYALRWLRDFDDSCSPTRLVSDIPGISKETSNSLLDITQSALNRLGGDEYASFFRTYNIFNVSDLLVYASLKLKLRRDTSVGEESLRKACMIIENLLRSKGVFIQDDAVIVEVLAAVCKTTPFTFIYHTYVPHERVFPTIRIKNAVCFRPLELEDTDAAALSDNTSLYSITEMYSLYKQLDFQEREMFAATLDKYVTVDISTEVLERAFYILNTPIYRRLKQHKQELKDSNQT